MRTMYVLFLALCFALLASAQEQTYVPVPTHVSFTSECPKSLSCAVVLAGYNYRLASHTYRKVGNDYARISGSDAARLRDAVVYIPKVDLSLQKPQLVADYAVMLGEAHAIVLAKTTSTPAKAVKEQKKNFIRAAAPQKVQVQQTVKSNKTAKAIVPAPAKPEVTAVKTQQPGKVNQPTTVAAEKPSKFWDSRAGEALKILGVVTFETKMVDSQPEVTERARQALLKLGYKDLLAVCQQRSVGAGDLPAFNSAARPAECATYMNPVMRQQTTLTMHWGRAAIFGSVFLVLFAGIAVLTYVALELLKGQPKPKDPSKGGGYQARSTSGPLSPAPRTPADMPQSGPQNVKPPGQLAERRTLRMTRKSLLNLSRTTRPIDPSSPLANIDPDSIHSLEDAKRAIAMAAQSGR